MTHSLQHLGLQWLGGQLDEYVFFQAEIRSVDEKQMKYVC